MADDRNEEPLGTDGGDSPVEDRAGETHHVLVVEQDRHVPADAVATTEPEPSQDPSAPDQDGAEGPATPSGPGTILIPAGERTLPADMRRSAAEAADPEEDEEEGSSSAAAAGEVPPRTPSSPDLPAASAAASSLPPSLPPVRPSSGPSLPPVRPSSGPSLPPVRPSSGPPVIRVPSQPPAPIATVDPEARRAAIAARRSRRTMFVVIGLLVVAALLAGAAILIVSSQRTTSVQQRISQVFTAHAIALQTIQDANDPVLEELDRLAADDQPDLTELVAVADEAGALFEGLVVPVAEGEFVQLARGLQNALDAEIAFLDRLARLGSLEFADIEQADIDPLLRSWDTAEDAVRRAYADQPALDVPDLAGARDILEAFGAKIVAAAADTRELMAELAEADRYVEQVQQALNDLEGLRNDLRQAALSTWSISSSSDVARAMSVVDAAAEGRWALAERMRSVTPPDAFVPIHGELVTALEQLGDVVTILSSAVYEAECYGYFFDDGCPTVGATDSFRRFARDSDTAGTRLDDVRTAIFATHARLADERR